MKLVWNWSYALLLGAALSLLAGPMAWARELKVAVGKTDYPPFYFQENASGPMLGISMEACEIVAKRLGHTLKYDRYPFARVVNSLDNGSADMVCNFFNTPARAAVVVFTSVPHVYESAFLFVKVGKNVDWKGGSLQQLSKYTFGGIRGYSFGQEYDTATYLQKDEATDEVSQIKMLLADRFDIGVGNKAALLVQAKALGVDKDLVFLEPVIAVGPVYMAFSKKLPDAQQLAADFSREIAKLRDTPEYKKILKKYGFDPSGH
jgi:ABC-type amino acid transport substrate-binding protein